MNFDREICFYVNWYTIQNYDVLVRYRKLAVCNFAKLLCDLKNLKSAWKFHYIYRNKYTAKYFESGHFSAILVFWLEKSTSLVFMAMTKLCCRMAQTKAQRSAAAKKAAQTRKRNAAAKKGSKRRKSKR